jgi:transcriptional regulator with XRE-family HTH domain
MTKGDRLKLARERLDMTQKDFAERLGIARASYNYIENNDKASLSDNLLSLIADLGISLDWVITGKGEMFLTNTPASDPENDLTGELEERIRRIKIDVSDIEDTVRRLIQKRK